MPRKPKTQPVTFARRFTITDSWYFENLDAGEAPDLLTKEQTEKLLNERAQEYASNYSRWGYDSPWDGDEPSVWVLLDDGTFREVTVIIPDPDPSITIKE